MRYLPITVSEVRAVLGRGCGDSLCNFVKPGGLHTNGGCRCFDKRPWHVLAGDLALLVLELGAIDVVATEESE